MATVEVKIPIYYARKQRYALEESYSRLNEAKQNYRSAQQQAVYQVKDQYLAIQSSERILNLYKTTLLPQAQLTVDSAASAYEVGNHRFPESGDESYELDQPGTPVLRRGRPARRSPRAA